ncbi:MAG: Ig-like domain-containing protein [bacterium]|nr:Ig-like domain-containing protein [bacterium]
MREAFTHLRADYSESDLTMVSNHCGDGYANDYTNYRKSYCSVTGYPTAMVDYIYKLVGTYSTWQLDYDWLKTRIDMQLAKESEATLDLNYFPIGDEVYLETTVNLEDDISNEWWVWMVVYQEMWDTYPLVVRAGDTTPAVLQISGSGESDSYCWGFDPTGWDTEHLVAVCFLEKNSGDKEVVQSMLIHLDLGSMLDTHEPIVEDIDPQNGEDDVPIDASIEFTLRDDSGINLDTLDFSVTDDTLSSGRALTPGGHSLSAGFTRSGDISGVMDIDDSDPQSVVCTFTPDDEFGYEATITCTIAAGLEDGLGIPTSDDFVWNFITEEWVRIQTTTWGAIKAQF